MNFVKVDVSSLKCCYTNARSLCNKLDEFFTFVTIHNPDVIAVTETWSNSDITDSCLTPPNYKLFRKDRGQFSNERGGGVVLLVKENLPSERFIKTDFSGFNESIWIKIFVENANPVLIGVCYRAPDNSEIMNKALIKDIQLAIDSKPSQLLVLGDFNLPGINFLELSAPNGFSSEFLDFVIDSMLVQHVEFDTRLQNEKSSLLDLVLSNNDNDVSDVKCLPPLGKSDHVFILFQYMVRHPSIPCINTPKDNLNYWKGDYERLNNEFDLTDWESELNSENIDYDWRKFKDIVLNAARKYIPPNVKKTSNSSKQRWITKKSIKVAKRKHKMHDKYRNSQRLTDYNNYVNLRNETTKVCREEKALYEKNLVNSFKKNPKRFYSHTKNIMNTKTGVPNLEKEDGNVTDGDQEIADVLNRYFQSVFVEEPDDVSNLNFPNKIDDELQLNDIEFTEQDIVKLLENLKPDKCPGPDQLHPKMLKHCTSLAKPLSIIFRKSLDCGLLPNDWKCSNVSPIFKKGSKSQSCNYRPVSLTSIICKLLETLINQKICIHLTSNELLSEHQHGFMSGRSCLSNLLETLECWTDALDNGNRVDCVYLDFRKAFDSVPFQRLLLKLRGYGINGKVLKWIESFLTGRKMRVGVRGSFSQWASVSSGVPQGSVLGPLLFLIYVNEIPDLFSCSSKIFADDTKVWSVIRDEKDCVNLQNDLNKISEWSDDWLLRLNTEKCKVMHVCTSRKKDNIVRHQYTMGDNNQEHVLESVESEKDLGVHVTDTLNPSKQCAEAVLKANKIIRIIQRSFRYIDKDSVLILYKTYIRPHLEYNTQAWAPYTTKDIKLLEGVQKRVSKLVPKLKNLSYEARIKELGLTTLEDRRTRGDIIETFKMLKGISNVDYRQFFTIDNSRRLRGHTLKLIKPRVNSKLRLQFFSQRVITLWNRLPQSVIDAESVNTFKNRLDDYHKKNGFGSRIV